ncbi:hypothetical protein P3T23_009832, partial [Paraburkholderia sp. GAS448]
MIDFSQVGGRTRRLLDSDTCRRTAGGSTGRNGRKFASLYIESACSRIRSGNDRFS